jgi:hypothetical protein
MFEEKGERLINRWSVNGVVVVQYEDKRIRDSRHVIQQSGEQRFLGRRLRRLQRGQHARADAGGERLQRGDEVCQKTDGVAVSFVQREPGNRLPAAGDPLAEQRGLAAAGGGRDERQLAASALIVAPSLVQARQQPWTVNRLWSGRRDIEFGG